MNSEKIIAGLDIGSDWIRASVGFVSEKGQLTVESLCERCSEGVRNGVIINQEQAFDVMYSVIQETELQAGVEVGSVVASVGGSSIDCVQSNGVAGINGEGLTITKADIVRSLEVARTLNLSQDRLILHTLVQDFSVDGHGGIKDPMDMTGHRLESRALVVTGSVVNCINTKKCIQRMGVSDIRLVLSSLADAESVLNQDEKEAGVILIDIGSNCTNLIAYKNGSPLFVGGIDIGSVHVTNDIAYLLGKPKQIAEQLKREQGCCCSLTVDPSESVIIPQSNDLPSIRLPKSEFCKIIEPRMCEIFLLLLENLKEHNVKEAFGSGIVLVGGGALLSGVADLAADVFGRQARIGFPEAFQGLDRSYINPRYSTVLGLLKNEAKKYGFASLNDGGVRRISEKHGIFRKISNFFKTVI